MAASIAGVLWQLVRSIRECRSGAVFREPRGYLPGRVDAHPNMSSPLFVVGLDDFKFSDGTHLRGRTLLIRKLGRLECQRRAATVKIGRSRQL